MPKENYFNFALIIVIIITEIISVTIKVTRFKKQLILIIVTAYRIAPDFTF